MMIQMRDEDARPDDPTSSSRALNCTEFQARMPQLMADDIHSHPHLALCDRCSALLHELEEIGIAAKNLLKPEYEPSDDVFKKLLSRIGNEESSGGSEHPTLVPGPA